MTIRLLWVIVFIKKKKNSHLLFKWVVTIGVPRCILGNADWERIGAVDVARSDTLFKTATRPKGMVLDYLERNDGRTWDKRNH
jgi:hypothetical protein